MAIYGISITIAVVCAVIGAFDTANTNYYIGTAGLTLLLAGLFFGIQPNLYKRNSRFATYLTMGIATLAWLFLILLMWNLRYHWFGPTTVSQMGSSFLVLFTAPFMIIGNLAVFRANWKWAGWTLLIGFAVVAMLILLAIWLQWKPMITTGIIVPIAVGLILVAPLQASSKVPLLVRQAASGLVVVATFVIARLFILLEPGSESRWDSDPRYVLWQLDFMMIAYGLAIITAVLGTMTLIRVSSSGAWLKWATVASTACTVVLLGLGFHDLFALGLGGFLDSGVANQTQEMSIFIHIGMASLIVTLALAIAVGFMARSSVAIVESIQVHLLSLTCPRCQRNCRIPEGDQQCPSCLLNFRVSFEAPDCRVCGTVLAPNFPDICPECGIPVVQESAPAPA